MCFIDCRQALWIWVRRKIITCIPRYPPKKIAVLLFDYVRTIAFRWSFFIRFNWLGTIIRWFILEREQHNLAVFFRLEPSNRQLIENHVENSFFFHDFIGKLRGIQILFTKFSWKSLLEYENEEDHIHMCNRLLSRGRPRKVNKTN